MPGSWTAGRRIATSSVWAGRSGCRRRNALRFGRSSKRCAPACEQMAIVTRATMFSRLAAELASRKQPPFEFVVVDESQDLSPPQLRFLAALGRRSAQRSLLRRRPRAADLSAAVLVEVARRRHPRPRPNAAHQLPHVASDPNAGRPAACARKCPTSMATRRSGEAPSRSSTARRRRSRSSARAEEEIDAVAAWLSERVQGGRCAARDRRLRALATPSWSEPRGSHQAQACRSRCSMRTSRRASGHASHQHDASRQGPGVPGRRGDGVRRRGHPAAGAHRGRDRRQSISKRSTTPSGTALRRLHAGAGPSAGDRYRASIGVPGRSTWRVRWRRALSRSHPLSQAVASHRSSTEFLCEVRCSPRARCAFHVLRYSSTSDERAWLPPL